MSTRSLLRALRATLEIRDIEGDVARTKIVYILVTDVGILSDDIVGNIDKITENMTKYPQKPQKSPLNPPKNPQNPPKTPKIPQNVLSNSTHPPPPIYNGSRDFHMYTFFSFAHKMLSPLTPPPDSQAPRPPKNSLHNSPYQPYFDPPPPFAKTPPKTPQKHPKNKHFTRTLHYG